MTVYGENLNVFSSVLRLGKRVNSNEAYVAFLNGQPVLRTNDASLITKAGSKLLVVPNANQNRTSVINIPLELITSEYQLDLVLSKEYTFSESALTELTGYFKRHLAGEGASNYFFNPLEETKKVLFKGYSDKFKTHCKGSEGVYLLLDF